MMLAVVGGLAAVGLALVGLALQRRWRRVRRAAAGLLLSYLTLVLLLGAGEAYFRFVHVDTEGRLASNNWMARYWRTNALGFRDRDWQPEDLRDRTRVAVVGDSFTAGWGLEEPSARFGDVLAAQLGDGYAVVNLGVPGASTAEELRTLQAYPIQPFDVIILQYFLNDIEYAALTLGQGVPVSEPPPLAQESYLANFIYARFTAGFSGGYWDWMFAAYDNPAIWNQHRQEIKALVEYVESQRARLIVVIFPSLTDAFGSIAYVDRVAQAFEENGQHDILKLFDAAADWNPDDLVISRLDPHASASFHRYVGEQLYRRFFAPGS